ncbi:hypothetical protein LCGC14_3003410, partial [marine sediment metagenome]
MESTHWLVLPVRVRSPDADCVRHGVHL